MAHYAFICDWCGNTAEETRPMKDSGLPGPVCSMCTGGKMIRDYRAEVGHPHGELPDWVSINAGVTVGRVADANKHYADMGVKFDKAGHAHVPGCVRNKFLKERGLCEI